MQLLVRNEIFPCAFVDDAWLFGVHAELYIGRVLGIDRVREFCEDEGLVEAGWCWPGFILCGLMMV